MIYLKLVVLAIVLFGATPSISQDTIYLDEKFKQIEKGKHDYFRVIEKMPAGKYKIRDYFKSGVIQMAGYADQPDDQHLTGTVVRYNANGTISSICEHKTYANGWITFYDDSFIKAATLRWARGEINGVAYFYNEKGNLIAKGRYKDGSPYNGQMPAMPAFGRRNQHTFIRYNHGKSTGLTKFYASGRKAMTGVFDNTYYDLASARYYSENGKLIGTCFYSGNLPVQGAHVEYYSKTFRAYTPAVVKYIETYVDSSLTERRSFTPHGEYLGSCTFKYGAPLEGKWLREKTLETYRNGQLDGEVVDWSDDLLRKSYSYNIHNGMKHGPTSYFHPTSDSVFVGNYIDDHPDTGYIYHKGELCYYIGAQKNGLCRSLDDKGNIASYTYYADNKKEGESVNYAFPKLGIIRGWNKSGEPFNGSFVKPPGRFITITHYEDGKQIRIKSYTPDSLMLFSTEDIGTQTITYYGTNGEIRFEGLRFNNKPFEGVFVRENDESTYQNGRLHGEKRYYNRSHELIKSETYRNDTLHGPCTVYKSAGVIETLGEYQNGKPYSGTILDKDGYSFYTYRRGVIHGLVRKKEGPFTCYYNYSDGQKDGVAYCWKKISWDSSDSTLVRCLMPEAKDTLRFSGIYLDGKPFNGTFAESNNMRQYVEGVLHGSSFKYTSSHGQLYLIAEEHFDHGLLDGEGVYYFNGRSFRSRYEKGQIINGIMPGEKESPLSTLHSYVVYKNGVPSGDTLIADDEYEWLYKKDGMPYDGFKRRDHNNVIIDEFKEGLLVKTSLSYFNTDTFWSIVYHGDSSLTYDMEKTIIARTTYSKPYSSGLAHYYNGDQLVSSINFENGFLKSGCLDELIPPGRFLDDTKRVRLCKDSNAVTILLEPGNKNRISKEIILPDSTIIPWPLVINSARIFTLTSVKEKTEKYYDLETGQLLATYISSQNESKGTQIFQKGNRFQVDHIDENQMESLNLSYDELLAKLAAWNK